MTATTTTPAVKLPVILSRTGYRRRHATNQVMLAVTGLLTVLAIVPLIWIIAYVVLKGVQYINVAFFTQMPRPMGMDGGGVLHAIEGTIVLTALSALFAIPPGIIIGTYAAQHPNKPRGVAVRFGTDVLSGVPTIIVGLFIYALVVKPQGHYSALAGGIALAIIMLPIIIRTTEEMLKLVPTTLREGSLALGAPDWKTSLSVIMPAAIDGIATGILLGLARASGEAAPLLFTALGNEHFEVVRLVQSGMAQHKGILATIMNVLDQPIDSLPLTLWKYSQEPYPERINQAWAAALVLMAFVLAANILARFYLQRRRIR
jgi:phosphate transport system permease protein